jgi:hypothetical protein
MDCSVYDFLIRFELKIVDLAGQRQLPREGIILLGHGSKCVVAIGKSHLSGFCHITLPARNFLPSLVQLLDKRIIPAAKCPLQTSMIPWSSQVSRREEK